MGVDSKTEEEKWTPKINKLIQRHKNKMGFLLGATLLTTVYYVPPDYTDVSCHDQSIRRPYHPDTISVKMLLTVSLACPFVTMMISERFFSLGYKKNCPSSFREVFHRSWGYITDLLVGGLLMFIFNDLAKTCTSEPRPSFWNACSPIVTDEQCQNSYVRITWRDCENPFNLSQTKLIDTMKSFPSGHASVSVYSSIITIVYIHRRMRSKSYPLLTPCLQIIWVVWALFCCQSRIWDNKHHWWDVLVGGILGAFGSFVTLKFFSNWFITEEYSENKQEDSKTT